jgi:hypothetical protein
MSLAKPSDKLWDFEEVVTVVGVPHDDVPATRGLDPSHQRAAVAFGRDGHDSGTQAPSDLQAAIGAAVVGDYDLASDPRFAHRPLGFFDARRQGVGLVEAGHHDRKFQLLGRCLGRHGCRGECRQALLDGRLGHAEPFEYPLVGDRGGEGASGRRRRD